MILAGSLDELPLLDVLQLLTVAGRSGTFRVSAPAGGGELHLSHGEIVDAKPGCLSGEPALFDLSLGRSGSFSFEPSDAPSENRTIHRPAMAVMTDAAHQLVEWTALGETVPSTRSVPVLSDEAPTANVVLTPSDWIVIRNIDGARTVEDIASAAKKSLFETCSRLTGLIRTGLVRPMEGAEGGASRTDGIESREEVTTI